MKSLSMAIGILCLVSTGVASGAGFYEGMEWSAVHARKDLRVQSPAVALHFGNVFNMCLDGATFRNIKPVKYCTELEAAQIAAQGDIDVARIEYVCSVPNTVNGPVATDLAHNEAVCTEFNPNYTSEMGGEFCNKAEIRRLDYPSSYDLHIYRNWGGSIGFQFDGTKRFTVPTCSK